MSKYFLYVGNAYPHKNLNRLISAMVVLNHRVKTPVLLKIASSKNVFTQRLEKAVKKHNAQKYVKLLGFVPDKILPSLYTESEAFVFPSLSEGFGLPGLEAMEAEALVLASDIPVFREVYKNNVIYFNPYETRAIVEAMEKALDLSKADKKKRIEKAKQFAKRYSWEKMASETLEVYLKLK